MNYCLILSLVLHFFGVIPQKVISVSDSLALELSNLSPLDSLIIDRRNDFVKRSLFANPTDSSLVSIAMVTLEAARSLGYQKGVLMANERLGLIYQYSYSNPYIALDYYHQALATAEQNPDLLGYKWGIKGNMATIYYEQEEFEKALELFREVSKNSKEAELTAILNIGNIFGATEKNDSAIVYFNKALTYDQIKNNPLQQANLYSNLSLIYVQAGLTSQAVEAAGISLKLVDSLQIDFVRPTSYANAAMAFLSVGAMEKAESLALESLKFSKLQGNLFIQKSAWGTLADIYGARGRYQEALEAYKEFSTLKDSLNNQNRRVEVSRKQMAFDFEKERNQSNAEIERQKLVRKYTLVIAFFFLLLLLIGLYFYKKRRDALAARKEAEFKALVFETELKSLRAQMNPHFIFNSLNSIGDYILKNDSAAAQDYLSKFGKLMRIVLENSGQNEIPLSEDLEFLELYLQIESKRQPGKFSYTIHTVEIWI